MPNHPGSGFGDRTHPSLVSRGEGNGVLREHPQLDFDPRRVSAPLLIWVRGDLGTTMNSDNVSSWLDQSGNGNDFAQSTASEQPELITGPSGRRVLRFLNADDTRMNNAATSFNMYSDLTDKGKWTVVVAVSDWTPTSSYASFLGANPVAWCGANGTTSAEICISVSSTTSNPVPLMGGVDASPAYVYANTASGADVDSGDPFVAVLWSDGSNWSSRTNGQDGDSNSGGDLRSNSDVFYLGDAKPPMVTGTAAEQFTGNILELLVFDGELEDDEMEELEAYIIDRYGMDV